MFYYHEATNHTFTSVRSGTHRLDWSRRPSPFKHYPDALTTIQLSETDPLHRFLYRIGGITAKKVYPGMEYYLRTVPSAGALYPTEIYFQSREVEGLEDGIWHIDVQEGALELLHRLAPDEGIEAAFEDNRAVSGLFFLFSAIYYRSSWKYRSRAFRYCLLDTGHVLGALEASAYLYDHAAYIRYHFDRTRLNDAFGFAPEEFFLTGAQVGVPRLRRIGRLEMRRAPAPLAYARDPLIEEAYRRSSKLRGCTPQRGYDPFSFSKEAFAECVMRRRSIRAFARMPIAKAAFDAIMETVRKKILSDCDEPVQIYTVVNAIEGMERGLYLENELVKRGDFRQKAGYLCLEQSLGSESAATLFLTGKSERYQPLMQKAGHLGHRLYLAADYLQIGCSGIGAYYDDEVRAFLQTEAMILYALAIGR